MILATGFSPWLKNKNLPAPQGRHGEKDEVVGAEQTDMYSKMVDCEESRK